MDLVGRTVGQYQIMEQIGQGGMAAVFKAYQPALDRFVALKVLPAQHINTPDFTERFEREAKAVAQLNHPNILPIIDYGQQGDVTYIVSKYVAGGTLADRLRRPIDLPSTARIVEQIAAALDHAHKRGIIHRDVKPSNVLLDDGEWVQLTDFGLAKILAGDSELTASGASLGSPAYISPEQGQGLPLDHHADIYSLGVLLFEMATGELPFSADTAMALVFKHIYETPQAPRALRPSLPEAVESVILKAMAKSIADRYHSAGDLARDLRQALLGEVSISAIQRVPSASELTPILGLQIDSQAEPSRALAMGPDTQLMVETVPAVPQFVGRDKELTAHRARLERDGFVIITGMAGAGKTTLGARLAHDVARRGAQIFWYTFDNVEKSTADALFWALAAFLESHSQPNLWHYLHGEVGSQKPLDRTVKMNLLLSGLSSGDYVLCFDDFQIVKSVPEVAYVFKLLQQRFIDLHHATPARMIVIGRDVPAEMEYAVAEPLSGFSYDETAQFIAARGLLLPPKILQRLWQRTEGNAKLLELSASALAGLVGDPEALEQAVDAMSRKGDIRDYLMTNIYTTLLPEEKLVMETLSVFSGPVDREVVEHMLDAVGIADTVPLLDALMKYHLLDEDDEEQIHCHSLVREYCYHVLNRKDKDRFHRLAAEYYASEDNYLAAAYHHFERRAQEQALELLTDHAQAIIAAGGAGALLEQLGRFERRSLSADQWPALCEARGAAYQMRGDYPLAVEAYQQALQDVISDEPRARLLRKIGSAYLKLGAYQRAEESLRQSLQIDEARGNPDGVADALYDLGFAYYRAGQIDRAREQFTHCLSIAQQLDNRMLAAQVDLGIGLIHWREGRLDEARQRFEASRRVFLDAGDRVKEAYAIGNLGLVYGELQDTDRQLACYRRALDIAEEIGDMDSLLIAFNNLGYLYHGRGDYLQAIHYYQRMAQLAQSIGHQRKLSMAEAGLADAQLGKGDPWRALEHAMQAHQLARDSSSQAELGVSKRVLGDIWLKLDNLEQAQLSFEQSIPLLEEASEEIELGKARHGLETALAGLATDSTSQHTGG